MTRKRPVFRQAGIKILLLGTLSAVVLLCLLVLIAPLWLEESGQQETSSSAADQTARLASDQGRPTKDAGRGIVVEGSLHRGIAAYESGNASELEKCVTALRVTGHEGQAQLLEGMLLELNGASEPALQAFHAAANEPTVKGRALALAGEIFYRQQDYVTAAGILQAAIVADPNLPGPHRLLAAWYYDTGAMDNALFHLEAITQLAPQDPRPWRLRGLILHDFERHPEAIEAYRQALQRNLKSHVVQEVRLELAGSLLATRRPQEALVELEQVTDFPESLALRADCLLALGQYDEAQVELDRALEVDPDFAKALMIKATLAREQGDKELAVQTLEHAVEVHPYEFDFRFHFASALNAVGRLKEAQVQQAEMERLRSLRDHFTELHHQSMQNTDSAELRVQLGQTAEQLGKWELASSWYQAALGLDPTNAQAQAGLAKLNLEQP